MLEDFAEKDSMALSEHELPKLRSYEPLQLFYMLRLVRLLRLRREFAGRSQSVQWEAKLLGKAVYSTYRDCAMLGLAEDAQSLFRKIKAESR